ncbi:class I SAM-dependent methyltransferase [Hasllibacter halocynthiae]|uniref:class I SAM-dependent methyltransferase n=1 Tax=Hasllibacter halocynthiae TaxID=595589 RepID=UPI0024820B15|nr:class I SAM-dependent methyltransferase [Hasllibacter halocynthiae]
MNVGAGAGSYEPAGRDVTAVEPSATMIAQRPEGAAPCVQAFAEALPFEDGAFDAAMAVLTVHHWSDPAKGLAEMRRVATRPLVLLTADPAFRGHWLHEYFPELVALDDRVMPPLDWLGHALGGARIEAVPVPHDCIDGFLHANWRRPEAYLDPAVRAASSGLATTDTAEGVERLARDLSNGTWERRFGHLRSRAELDCGYRLVVAG